jgi:hypothetical protein
MRNFCSMIHPLVNEKGKKKKSNGTDKGIEGSDDDVTDGVINSV